MANKTPGQVDHAAFQQAQCEWLDTRVRSWEEETLGIRNCHEAAAQAVRKQVADQDIAKLEKLRLDLSWWWIQDWAGDTDMALSHLLDAVGPFMPDESDEPTPEAAEACAEDAGAEPSKSPPPAKR